MDKRIHKPVFKVLEAWATRPSRHGEAGLHPQTCVPPVPTSIFAVLAAMVKDERPQAAGAADIRWRVPIPPDPRAHPGLLSPLRGFEIGLAIGTHR